MAAQAALVLGIPFVSVNGQSALRFDVPSLTLFFFGAQIGMDEFFLVLVTLLFLGFLIVLLTVLLGRVWCGWLCPQTVIVELTRSFDRMRPRGAWTRIVSLVALLVVSSVLAASLVWYFVSPSVFLSQLASGKLVPVVTWSWLALTVVTFLNFAFLRRRFCISVCPYARLQGAFYDDRTLVIAPDVSRMNECMGCDACVHACPVDIDVRSGLDAACVNCAECIDACARQRARLDRQSLIGYRFGTGRGGKTFRTGVLLAGIATAVFLALLLALVSGRPVFELDLAADPAAPPRRTGGAVVNTYMASLTNRSDRELHLELTAMHAETGLAAHPELVTLTPGQHRRIAVTVTAPAGAAKETARTITVVARSRKDEDVKAEAQVQFLLPW